MNMQTNTLTRPGTDDVLTRFSWRMVDAVLRWLEHVRAEREYRRAEAALQAMNAHQLRDLGIHRGDIPLVVRGLTVRRREQ